MQGCTFFFSYSYQSEEISSFGSVSFQCDSGEGKLTEEEILRGNSKGNPNLFWVKDCGNAG